MYPSTIVLHAHGNYMCAFIFFLQIRMVSTLTRDLTPPVKMDCLVFIFNPDSSSCTSQTIGPLRICAVKMRNRQYEDVL